VTELNTTQASGRIAEAEIAAAQQQITALIDALERVIVGKRDILERVIVALLGEGHVLIEDVPGVGKTVLARSIAAAIGGSFQRIQFTPDLLPSDVTGALVFDPRTSEFHFRPGPIVANIVLADEINRAGPRTQAALLEAMEERHLTVDRERLPLPRPFFVLATQNPVEMDGTFPLPEAQLDRFALRTSVGYPDGDAELAMLRRFRDGSPLESLQPVLTLDALSEVMALVRRIWLSEAVERYLLEVVRATREDEQIELGASPRASLALARASQALALVRGRGFVLPDDVQAIATSVLAHRILPVSRFGLRGTKNEALIDGVLERVPVPAEPIPS
jgi:MoxR-like ATPase